MVRKNRLTLTFASCGLNHKLRIAVYLMAILPLLVSLYLISTYILPKSGFKPEILVSLAISLGIAVSGYFVIREIFNRIRVLCEEAKLIASGDVNRIIEIYRKDEVGDLADSLNQLTQYIRNNMNELENYSEKTSHINLEIQKRVFLLSNLMHISTLVSQGASFNDILKAITEKSRLMANSDLAYILLRDDASEEDLFYVKLADGVNTQNLSNVKINTKDEMFGRVFKSNKPLVLDGKNVCSQEAFKSFHDKFGVKNTLAQPIYLRGRVVAVLGIGNNRDAFVYDKDDMALLDIFAKQMAIALENDILMHRVEKLEIRDALTGLYNELFIRNRLQEEIRRAILNRRPCAFIVLDIDNFRTYDQNFGALQRESALKKIAYLLLESVSEIDRVARFGDDSFAVVLPDKNKRQAFGVAEEIRKKIEFVFGEEQSLDKRLTMSGGVSENPLDGIEAEELIEKAKKLLKVAKEQGKNRIMA